MPLTSETARAANLKRKNQPKKPPDPRYDPLGYCPPENRSRYGKRAESAVNGGLSAAIELACIHCMGWQPTLVAGCTDPSCPLWLRATRKGRGIS